MILEGINTVFAPTNRARFYVCIISQYEKKIEETFSHE